MEHISYIIRGSNLKFGVWMNLGMRKCRVPKLGHCDLELTSDLVSRNCNESGAYLLYSLR